MCTLESAIKTIEDRDGRPHEFDWDLADAALVVVKRLKEVESAISETLNNNLHLADGDVCTLSIIKKVMESR